ncbi:MAG: hypothetical protein O6939_02680 [Bacteroidetes bacterium]|nr:hypothetical protein [Bacteroidota bacterium]
MKHFHNTTLLISLTMAILISCSEDNSEDNNNGTDDTPEPLTIRSDEFSQVF